MGKVYSVLNFKGGVGKTTTTINLGAALARMKKKVLIIDLDGQKNSTTILGFKDEDGENIYDFLTGRTQEVFAYNSHTKGLDYVPSSTEMRNIELNLNSRKSREHILEKFTEKVRPEYDYILIDCPPGKGVIIDNAMTASDGIIIPIECEMLSLQGLTEIVCEVNEVKSELNPELEIVGFLATKYDGRLRLNRDILSGLNENFPGKVFQTKIRRNVSLAEFCQTSQHIFDYAPDSYGAEDYESLAYELTGEKKKKIKR